VVGRPDEARAPGGCSEAATQGADARVATTTNRQDSLNPETVDAKVPEDSNGDSRKRAVATGGGNPQKRAKLIEVNT